MLDDWIATALLLTGGFCFVTGGVALQAVLVARILELHCRANIAELEPHVGIDLTATTARQLLDPI